MSQKQTRKVAIAEIGDYDHKRSIGYWKIPGHEKSHFHASEIRDRSHRDDRRTALLEVYHSDPSLRKKPPQRMVFEGMHLLIVTEGGRPVPYDHVPDDFVGRLESAAEAAAAGGLTDEDRRWLLVGRHQAGWGIQFAIDDIDRNGIASKKLSTNILFRGLPPSEKESIRASKKEAEFVEWLVTFFREVGLHPQSRSLLDAMEEAGISMLFHGTTKTAKGSIRKHGLLAPSVAKQMGVKMTEQSDRIAGTFRFVELAFHAHHPRTESADIVVIVNPAILITSRAGVLAKSSLVPQDFVPPSEWGNVEYLRNAKTPRRYGSRPAARDQILVSDGVPPELIEIPRNRWEAEPCNFALIRRALDKIELPDAR